MSTLSTRKRVDIDREVVILKLVLTERKAII